jgi:hypothetical protein
MITRIVMAIWRSSYEQWRSLQNSATVWRSSKLPGQSHQLHQAHAAFQKMRMRGTRNLHAIIKERDPVKDLRTG